MKGSDNLRAPFFCPESSRHVGFRLSVLWVATSRIAWNRPLSRPEPYDAATNTSAPGPADLVAITETSRSDWGNIAQVVFAEHVRSWPNRLWVSTASGYFAPQSGKTPSALVGRGRWNGTGTGALLDFSASTLQWRRMNRRCLNRRAFQWVAPPMGPFTQCSGTVVSQRPQASRW